MKTQAFYQRTWLAVGVILGLVAMAAFTGCGRSGTTSRTPVGGAGPTKPGALRAPVLSVAMTSDKKFDPREVTVAPGDTVMWTNTDTSKPHTVTPDKPGAGPDSDVQYPNGIEPGKVYHWTVPKDAKPGTVWYYHCRFHGQAGNGSSFGSGMSGAVKVTAQT